MVSLVWKFLQSLGPSRRYLPGRGCPAATAVDSVDGGVHGDVVGQPERKPSSSCCCCWLILTQVVVLAAELQHNGGLERRCNTLTSAVLRPSKPGWAPHRRRRFRDLTAWEVHLHWSVNTGQHLREVSIAALVAEHTFSSRIISDLWQAKGGRAGQNRNPFPQFQVDDE